MSPFLHLQQWRYVCGSNSSAPFICARPLQTCFIHSVSMCQTQCQTLCTTASSTVCQTLCTSASSTVCQTLCTTASSTVCQTLCTSASSTVCQTLCTSASSTVCQTPISLLGTKCGCPSQGNRDKHVPAFKHSTQT
eukprot:jgi/Botrbrau1/1250/Bobra.0163s0043.1